MTRHAFLARIALAVAFGFLLGIISGYVNYRSCAPGGTLCQQFPAAHR